MFNFYPQGKNLFDMQYFIALKLQLAPATLERISDIFLENAMNGIFSWL